MDKNYKLTVNDANVFNATASEITNLDAVETKTSHFHILKENQRYTAEIIHTDFLNKT